VDPEPKKLLIVDDEEDIVLLFRQRFRRQVRKKEVELLFAHDGREALKVLSQHSDIRVVLSDINMPRMDGLTLLGEIQRLERILEVVVVSAYGDMDNIRVAMNRGAFDFLTKPIDFLDLDATVQKTQQRIEGLLEAQEAGRRARELEQKNRFIRDTFGRYTSEDVVCQLLDEPEGLSLGGERRPLTVLCSDLRGFVSLSEVLSPEQVVSLLNRYLEVMFEVILRHQGTINEISGDGLMVFFGAPIQQPNSAQRAVACAIDMQLALDRLQREADWRERFPIVEMGIGVHTGNAVVGNIGSQQRTKYSAVGSDINRAARVEGCTVGGQVLITEETLQAAGPDVQVNDSLEVTLKGVTTPVTLFDVAGMGGEYDLRLQRTAAPRAELKNPLPARFWVLKSKATDGDACEGELVRLSPNEAEIATAAPMEPLSDLRLELLGEGGQPLQGELYCKVLAEPPRAEGAMVVRFTSVPPELQKLFEELLLPSA